MESINEHDLYINEQKIGTYSTYEFAVDYPENYHRFAMISGYTVEIKNSTVKKMSKVFSNGNTCYATYITLRNQEETKAKNKEEILQILQKLDDREKLRFYNAYANEASLNNIIKSSDDYNEYAEAIDDLFADMSPSEILAISRNSDCFNPKDAYFSYREDTNDLVSGDLDDLIDFDDWANYIVENYGIHKFDVPSKIEKMDKGGNFYGKND